MALRWGYYFTFNLCFNCVHIKYLCLSIRGIPSSIQTIDRGQFEAAYSIGMTTFQAIKRIIFPQSLVAAIPNLGNIFISLIKATSLAFAVKVVEIMAISKVIANDGYRYLEMYLVASLIYWILCFFFERLFVVIEKKLSHYELREEVRSAS